MFKYEATAPTPEGLLSVLRNELGHLFSGDASPRVASEAPVADASPSSAPAAAAEVQTEAASAPSTPSVSVTPPKPRGRPPGSKKSAAPSPAADTAASSSPTPAVNSTAALATADKPGQVPTAGAAVISLDDVKDAFRPMLSTDDGINATEAILASFGAKKFRDIKPEDFAAAHAKATAYVQANKS
jgi:hypothetical protein